jgi:hypothetical protein
MTICISALCEMASNVVLATDSMITNPGLSIEFEHPTKKTTLLSDSCAALTAGDALAHTELFNMVYGRISALKDPSTFTIVETIKECYRILRNREIKETILNPNGFDDFGDFYRRQQQLLSDFAFSILSRIERYDYGLDILIGGVDGKRASIYGITNPGTSKCFDSIGFHAIGSGLPHALNTLIAKSCCSEITLGETILIVYDAKKMAEKAPGVGSKKTNLSIVRKGQIIEFSDDKIEELNDIYKKWSKSSPIDVSVEIKDLLNKIGVKNEN